MRGVDLEVSNKCEMLNGKPNSVLDRNPFTLRCEKNLWMLLRIYQEIC